MAIPKRTTAKRRTKTRAAASRGRRAAPLEAKVTLERLVRTLQRRLAVVTKAMASLRDEHQRRLVAVRRAADRKLAVMVHELAALRHHEARAAAFERLLAERTAAETERRGDGETPGTPG